MLQIVEWGGLGVELRFYTVSLDLSDITEAFANRVNEPTVTVAKVVYMVSVESEEDLMWSFGVSIGAQVTLC